MLASRPCENYCASDGVAEVKYPEIDYDLDLGVLGKQCAQIGYSPDANDVQYVVVENGPLYLELEITTLDCVTQDLIAQAIHIDSLERAYAADRHRRDMAMEDGCVV